ncbi:MAG: aspartate/glutamate racemase family protein [Lentisphaerae bacterium]|nr:aspartate/glutamate racemase family protein [Lentisphaerota bacterium]
MQSTVDKPLVGVLCWEAGSVPMGLLQLELLPGNSTNLETYKNLCRVQFSRIKGANVHTILENPCKKVLAAMIDEGRRLVEQEGAGAITTSCGFNAVNQPQLAAGIPAPVFSSSLLQVPALALATGRKVGIITASAKHLTAVHLRNAGITEDIPVVVKGLDDCSEWQRLHKYPNDRLDLSVIEEYLVQMAKDLHLNDGVGSLLLECTDLPPFAERLRQETSLPVADYVSMVHWLLKCVPGSGACRGR